MLLRENSLLSRRKGGEWQRTHRRPPEYPVVRSKMGEVFVLMEFYSLKRNAFIKSQSRNLLYFSSIVGLIVQLRFFRKLSAQAKCALETRKISPGKRSKVSPFPLGAPQIPLARGGISL